MAFYSDEKVKTELVDPHLYLQNERVEFRLDSGTILNNLKIGNLGATSASTSPYNIDAGVLGVIKKISLFDGAVILQEQQKCNEHMAFVNSLVKNEVNGNKDRFLKHHGLGYTIGSQITAPLKSINILNNAGNAVLAADSLTNTSKGLINVKELLPIVAKMDCLSAKVFPQLRLVIEYEQLTSSILKSTAQPHATTRPFLVVDRVVDENNEKELIAKLASFNFMNYEYSQITLPRNTQGVQEFNAKVMAFNNKTLNRLRLKYNLTEASERDGNDDRARGLLGTSHNHNNRTIQYRVNGSALFTQN